MNKYYRYYYHTGEGKNKKSKHYVLLKYESEHLYSVILDKDIYYKWEKGKVVSNFVIQEDELIEITEAELQMEIML